MMGWGYCKGIQMKAMNRFIPGDKPELTDQETYQNKSTQLRNGWEAGASKFNLEIIKN